LTANSTPRIGCSPEVPSFAADDVELSNVFTNVFKKLDSIPRFKATAKLGEFLEARFSQTF
jgi:hypothetical protein